MTRGAERLGATLKAAPIGATVTSVTPGSPAASAGLQVGDNIFKVNGRIPTGHIQALKWIDSSPEQLGLIVKRGGGEVQYQILLPPPVTEADGIFGAVVAAETSADASGRSSAAPPPDGLRLGVALDTAGARGVKIVDVVAGTPAQTAGLAVGDRVVRVQGVAVNGLQHAVDLVHQAPATMVIDIKRNGIPLSLHIGLSGEGAPVSDRPAEAPRRAMAGKMAVVKEEPAAMAVERERRAEAEAAAVAATARDGGIDEQTVTELKMLKRLYDATDSEVDQAEIRTRMKQLAMEAKAAAVAGAAPPPPAAAPAETGSAAAASSAAPAPQPVQGAVAAATTGPVGPASPLIPMGTSGKKNMNYSCGSGRAGTATVPVGSCQSDRDQYARAVACGERSDVKRSCEQLYRCLGQDVSAYCPF